MRILIFQPQARLDLLEIWHYIAKDSIEAANRVGQSLDDAIVDLCRMPGKGHARTEIRDPRYRCWPVYSYVIIYRYDSQTLTVIRVIHGARDFNKIFES